MEAGSGIGYSYTSTRQDYHTLSVFFFQAEDGIRDLTVTGVQTCALPIFPLGSARASRAHCGASPQLLGKEKFAMARAPSPAREARALPRFARHATHLRLHKDRKRTRLNSSHSQLSYAVFCLKQKHCIHRS